MPNTHRNRVLSAAGQIREELSKHNAEIVRHTTRAQQLQTALDALVGGNSPTTNRPGVVRGRVTRTGAWWHQLSPEQREVVKAKRRATMAETRQRKSQQATQN